MTDIEDEFTELVDADIPRVDLVDKAANGMRFLLAKQAEGAGGLLDPDFVRDLLAKAEDARPERVTMSGTPAAIAKLIHEAAIRGVSKARTSQADQNDLPDSDFAYIEDGGHKDEDGKTVPRSLRHFPINDEAHARNALARAPQSPFGDKALPKIRAAAKRFGIDVTKETQMEPDDGGNGIDTETPLATPADDAPGDPDEPGSPAWEAVDAATAQKWTSVLARARRAIDTLAEREMLEAEAGDPDDFGQAMDLQDACCAIDYAISILAPFAVAEQAEAEGAAAEMAAVGKALAAWDTAPLDTIEALSHVAKAGRVLSSANEAAIRGAVDSLQKVLSSLPVAPEAPDDSGLPVAKEETVADTTQTDPGSGVGESLEKGGDAPGQGAETVEKAPEPQVAVYDKTGRLVGVVAPDSIVPIAEPEGDDTPAEEADAEAGIPQTADLDPAPADQVGTPADAVPDDVTKHTDTPANDAPLSEAVFKSIAKDEAAAAVADYNATQEQVIAKQAADLAQLAETVETLKGLVKALEEQPAEPKVFTHGAVPPAHLLRGHDRGADPSAVSKAQAMELKKGLYEAPDASQQNRIAADMQGMAIARLQEIHQRRASQ